MSTPSEMPEPSISRPTWWRNLIALRADHSNLRILGGSLTMLVGSSFVSLVSFGYNVAVARMLGPVAFGHAAAVVTMLMLLSAITLAFQLVCAKFVARNETAGAKSAVYAVLRRRAWFVGVLLGSVLILLSAPVATYLNLPSPVLVVLLGLGVAFYIPVGVKRGGLQGIYAFSSLTVNFILEALVKFAGAILLIQLGYGVTGAVSAIAASVVIAYFLPLTPRELEAPADTAVPASFREGMQAIVFFVGQVIINNIDILLVKHFFHSDLAGLYAAVALVGRVVYLLSWSVVSAMFPISAGVDSREKNPASVLVVPLLLVLSIAMIFTLGLGLFPRMILQTVFGAGFNQAGRGFDSLLMLYAACTGAYSLSVVLMAYEMSRKLANTGWIQLVFSGGIVLGIYSFHSTLRQVITVQLVMMVLLLITASLPFFRPRRRSITAELSASLRSVSGIERVQRVPEANVIADFLRNEFYHEEFHRDRDRFERLVMQPDTNNEVENALRRALLFRRRGTMWRELPADTEWWEIQLSSQDLAKIRVFPRAQWRKVASGSFVLNDIVTQIRTRRFTGRTCAFISKIQSLGSHLQLEPDGGSILLIGIDEHHPLTIIEGNHRLTAAVLTSPELAKLRFRFLCGFSPNMAACCWYQTTFANLWRYARNRLRIVMYDREADIGRLMQHPSASFSDDVRMDGANHQAITESK